MGCCFCIQVFLGLFSKLRGFVFVCSSARNLGGMF